VKRVCALIYENYTSKNNQSIWHRILNRAEMSRQSRIDGLVLKIKDVADYGLHRAVPTSLEVFNKTNEERKNVTKHSLIGSLTPSVAASESEDSFKSNGIDEKTSFIYNEVSRYQVIRQLLEEFFDTVGLSRFFILIDEWTT
jgi:ribosomal protein L18E